MANVDIAVKNIIYNFAPSKELDKVKEVAEKTAKELYQDEQEFQNEEYETMLEDGDVSSYEEYRDAVGIEENDIDYRKSFEENINHPDIQSQLAELTNKYMCNVLDLPKDAVVTIDDSNLNEKGKPDIDVVRFALREKFGENVNVIDYRNADIAKKGDILAQQSYEKVGDMIKSHDFQTFLELRASIEKYSSKNISMIYLQKPDAKAVMGFQAWKDYDRHVDGGQNAINIWQPCKKELKTEEQVDKEIANNEWIYGKPDSKTAIKEKERMMDEIKNFGKTEVFSGYKLGNVFDISQTVPNDLEHDNLMQIVNLEKPLDKDMENYNDIVKSMQASATLASFSVDSKASQQEALFNSVVEYADKVFAEVPQNIDGIKSNVAAKGDMHEVETLMSAYLVCRHIGIECEDKVSLKLAEIFNKDNLSEQAITIGKREMFNKSFDRACKFSDQFTKAFDKDFGYSLEAQREALKKSVAEKKEAQEAEFKAKAETRVWFGRTPAQKVDEWQKDGNTYIIGQVESTGKFCAKLTDENKKATNLRDSNGKPAIFDSQPSRADIEQSFFDNKEKAEPEKKKTLKDEIEKE